MIPPPAVLCTILMLPMILRGTLSSDRILPLDNSSISAWLNSLQGGNRTTAEGSNSSNATTDEAYKDNQNEILEMDGFKRAKKKTIRLNVEEIFGVPSNESIVFLKDETNSNVSLAGCMNSSLYDYNNFMAKCNYSLVEEKVKSLNEFPVLGTVDTVAVAAGICLVSAVIGYFSCVGYRRYLQRKYGDNEIVAQEDVYDTTDLRYFEI